MAKHKIVYMPIDELQSAPHNAKDHDDALIDESIARFGYGESVLLDERTGFLVAGHGRRDRLVALHAAGATVPDGIEARKGRWYMPVERGWTSKDDLDAIAAGVAFNYVGEKGGWKTEELWSDLTLLADTPLAFDGIGFTMDDLDTLAQEVQPATREGAGELLALVDVTVDEPTHEPLPHSVWELSGRHVLIVADVMTGWAEWIVYLENDGQDVPTVLCPYPGPYLALSREALTIPLVLVQPDTYLAGHLLDKYASVYGVKAVVELDASA